MTTRLRAAAGALWIPVFLVWGCAPAAPDNTTDDGGTSRTDGAVSIQDSPAIPSSDVSGMCGSMGYPCCPEMQCLPGYTCTDNLCAMDGTDGSTGTSGTDGSTVLPDGMDSGILMLDGMDSGTGMGMIGPPDVLSMPPVDANPSVCRAPIEGAACSVIVQTAMPVAEMRVATAPPPTTAGWYPAGPYQLTAATLYTGPGGASGLSGLSYAVSLQVNGIGTTDYYQVVRTQSGCPTSSFRFSGDTASSTTSLGNVGWMCPTCSTCPNTLPYTGTLTGLLLYFPQPDGTTLAEEFAYMGSLTCGSSGMMCCGNSCFPGYTCSAGMCVTNTSDGGTVGGPDSGMDGGMVGGPDSGTDSGSAGDGPCGTEGNACCARRTCLSSALICNAMNICQG